MSSKLTSLLKKIIFIPLSLLIFILIIIPLGFLTFILNKLGNYKDKKSFWLRRSRKMSSMDKQF